MRGKIKAGLDFVAENFTGPVERLQGDVVAPASDTEDVPCVQQLAR